MHVRIDWTYRSIELMSRPETATHVLAGFFPGPRGPLKESSIPHPSFLPPVHHSSAIFILQDTLLIFKIQSKYFHFANIFSPPQKNSLFKYFSSQFFHPHKKIFAFYKCFPSFHLHSSSHTPNNNYFPLSKYFPSFLSPLLAPEVLLEDL